MAIENDGSDLPDDDLSIDDVIANKWAEIQARGDSEEESGEQSPVEKTEAAAGEQSAVGGEASETGELKPPSSWTKEAKERFKDAPPEIQREVLKREDDFHKGVSQYRQAAEAAKIYEPLQPAFQELGQRYGGDPVQSVARLVELDRFATQDPIAFIKWFAGKSGVSLDGTGVENYQQNPVLQSLQQQVQQLTGWQQNQQQTHEQQRQQEALTAIEQFKSSGKAEHFDALSADMAALLQAGLATDINDAYERALWQRPDLRQGLINQHLKVQQEQAKKQAAEARRAGKVNIPQRGVLPNKTSTNPDDIIRQKAIELGFT